MSDPRPLSDLRPATTTHQAHRWGWESGVAGFSIPPKRYLLHRDHRYPASILKAFVQGHAEGRSRAGRMPLSEAEVADMLDGGFTCDRHDYGLVERLTHSGGDGHWLCPVADCEEDVLVGALLR